MISILLVLIGIVAACILWVKASFLAKESSARRSLLLAAFATFISALSFAYILHADNGFSLGADVAYPVSVVFAVLCGCVFLWKIYFPGLKRSREQMKVSYKKVI